MPTHDKAAQPSCGLRTSDWDRGDVACGGKIGIDLIDEGDA
jgi:hypothetical protein